MKNLSLIAGMCLAGCTSIKTSINDEVHPLSKAAPLEIPVVAQADKVSEPITEKKETPDTPSIPRGVKFWGRAGGYYDTRGRPTASFTGGAWNLPLDAELFGFIDVAADKNDIDQLLNPYAEIKLSRRWGITEKGILSKCIGPALEYNRDFSLKKGIFRLGLTFEPDFTSIISDTIIGTNIYPVSSEDAGSQIVFYGFKGFNDRNQYLDGFFDCDFNPQGNAPEIVAELQFGQRLWKDLYGVVEARYNGYIEDDEFGVGIGLECHLK